MLNATLGLSNATKKCQSSSFRAADQLPAWCASIWRFKYCRKYLTVASVFVLHLFICHWITYKAKMVRNLSFIFNWNHSSFLNRNCGIETLDSKVWRHPSKMLHEKAPENGSLPEPSDQNVSRHFEWWKCGMLFQLGTSKRPLSDLRNFRLVTLDNLP